MIKAIKTLDDGTVYALSRRGVVVLAAAVAIALSGLGASVSALRTIDEQRSAQIRTQCLEANVRHAQVIAGLEALETHLARPEAYAERLRQHELLVEFAGVLAPHEDCRARVNRYAG